MEKFWNFIESIVRFFLIKLFRLKLSDSQIDTFMQFIKFGVVGVSNTVVSYVIYLVFFSLFRFFKIFPRADYMISQYIAFFLAVLWSFYWNNKYVFGEEKGKEQNMWKALFKMYVSYSLTGLILSPLALILWVEVIGIPKTIAPLINSVLFVPINFIINKLWAFRGKKSTADKTADADTTDSTDKAD